MNILMVGSGKGSWEMRGQQVGAALGARVTSHPSDSDWRWAQMVILIKHAAAHWASTAHCFGVPIVWDVLDIWKQPTQNHFSVQDGIRLVQSLKDTIRPAAMIAATQAMAEDIGGTYIPHHCRIGLTPTPPRIDMQVVGYEGSPRYLGRWEGWIRQACKARGWQFVINPPDIRDCDVLVAFRDGEWDGPLCRGWKSGVKYANALCAGRPIVTQECAARAEMSTALALVANDADLPRALEEAITLREPAYALGTAASARWTVEAIAERFYRPLLRFVGEPLCIA